MRPAELLQRLRETDEERSELNADAMERLLAEGGAVVAAELLEEGLGSSSEPLVLLRVRTGELEQTLPLGLGPGARRLLLGALEPAAAEEGGLREELAEGLRSHRHEANPEERTSLLVDWMLERTKATRCALVPFEGGAMAEPIVLELRGRGHDMLDPRHVPRRVVAAVARSRRPLGSHESPAAIDPGVADPRGTIARQGVRAWWAVPVVFRGRLLAVAHVDRIEGEGAFTREERAAFEAFAYELARPLLELQERRQRREHEGLRDLLLARGGEEAAEPSSEALERVLEAARRLAPHADESLLVLGETGVGKEWLARRIHELSGRTGPFVPVNVSALPAELFESELLGSKRGAYTGAVDRPGRVVEAEHGTLFLDEIGDLPEREQVRLLRLLQEKSVRPVGGGSERRVDVRFIAATNRDLASLERAGAFRADLLHRFAPPLLVPPLRERREEILAHVSQWLEAKARERGLPPARLDRAARDFLLEHPWPGNVRQLRAAVGHALLLAEGGRIDRALLESLGAGAASRTEPAPGPRANAASPPGGGWDDFVAWRDAREREWLRAALERHDGNVEATARAIGCPRTSLRRLLQRHGLSSRRG